MKQPEFLKNLDIGKIIRTEMEKHHLMKDIEMIAAKINRSERTIRNTFKEESIKINRLIDLSYAAGVDFLQACLKGIPLFGNVKYFEDEVVIDIIDGQISMIPSKRSRTADFTKHIHIGSLLKIETAKQGMQEILQGILHCTQSAISKVFDKPDIDTKRLIWLSYILNYDFIRNIYLPYMAVNENEMLANDCISDPCRIKIKPEKISIITEEQMGIYHGIWSPK
jgi:hypothetical protein